MHIKWAYKKKGTLLAAYLVQSTRDGKRVRHRYIEYLGSVRVEEVLAVGSADAFSHLRAVIYFGEYWQRHFSNSAYYRDAHGLQPYYLDRRLATRIPEITLEVLSCAKRKLRLENASKESTPDAFDRFSDAIREVRAKVRPETFDDAKAVRDIASACIVANELAGLRTGVQ